MGKNRRMRQNKKGLVVVIKIFLREHTEMLLRNSYLLWSVFLRRMEAEERVVS